MPFARLGLPAPIVKGVRAAGYSEPTPIQVRAIPIILAGHDLVAAAQTGTGKTAAFVLPILARLLKGDEALRALILVPTRELAAQVETNARDYARFTGLRAGVVYGGVPIPPQERMLRNEGVDLLVATPGRLLDLHGRQSVSLEDIEVLVLDEADRMVDMGFAPDLKRILRLIPTRRQTLMFSATMPPELNRVASEAMKTPQRVDLAPPSRPAAGITQAIYPVPRHLKTDMLDEMLGRSEVSSAIVFTRTKHGADRLTRQLEKRGHSVAALHGDRSQSQRERALASLKRGRIQFLVATDIASRGIDVKDISHIINYDVPHTPEDYVHRIGRTGRVDAVGDAFTLMSSEEEKDVQQIERFLGRSIPRVTLPDFDYKRRAEPRSRDEGGRGGEGRGRRSGAGGGGGGGESRGRGRAPVARREWGGRVLEPSDGDRPARSSDRAAGDRPSAGASADSITHGRRPRAAGTGRRRRM
ncbi:MAG: DEAD/DEAH box helicase [Candidatus Eisenbacteria bacterium]